MPTFDLTREPWLPCLDAAGRPCELGLYEALARAHELRGVAAATPLETAAIYRLLLAVLHRVFPTPSARAWRALWERGSWDEAALAAYFDRWRERFDLFHPERPFYQAKDDRIAPRSVALLFPGMAAAAFYNHDAITQDLALPPATAARFTLVAQSYGLAGIAHPQLNLFFNSAPWLVGVVLLVEGDTLFQTLALNVLRYDERHPLQELCGSEEDKPAWEMDDPFSPEREVPLGYLDYLTWQNRRLHLLPEETENGPVVKRFTATPGLKLSLELRDPMKHYRRPKDKKKSGWRARPLDPRRALWRDSVALLNLRDTDARPPCVLEWLAGLVEKCELDETLRYRLLGIGMLNDQGKGEMFRAERMPLPLAYLRDEELLSQLATAVDQAEQARGALSAALWLLARFCLARDADLAGGREPDGKDVRALVEHWGAEGAYWAELELPFLRLVDDLPAGTRAELLARWRATVRRAAFAALAVAERLAGDGAEALKASAQARRLLAARLAEKKETAASAAPN